MKLSNEIELHFKGRQIDPAFQVNVNSKNSELLSSFNHGTSGLALNYTKKFTYLGLFTAWCAAVVGLANSRFQQPNSTLSQVNEIGTRAGMVVVGIGGCAMALVVMSIFAKLIMQSVRNR